MIQAAQRELLEETGLQATLLPGFEKSLKYVFKERGKLVEKTVTFLWDALRVKQNNFHESTLVISGFPMNKRIKSLPIKMRKRFWLKL